MSLRDVTRKALAGMRKAKSTVERLDEGDLDEGVKKAEAVIRDHAQGMMDGHHKSLTHIATDRRLHGVHFKHVVKAAENLHKKGVVHFDGSDVGRTKTTDAVKEGEDMSPERAAELKRAIHKAKNDPMAKMNAIAARLAKKQQGRAKAHEPKHEATTVDNHEAAADEHGAVHVVHAHLRSEYHFNRKENADAFHRHAASKGCDPHTRKLTDHESRQRSGATHAVAVDHSLHEGVDESGMEHDEVLHHPAAEPAVHAALKHVGGKSHGVHKNEAGEHVHRFSVPRGKSRAFGDHYNQNGVSKIPEHERSLGHWHIPRHDESVAEGMKHATHVIVHDGREVTMGSEEHIRSTAKDMTKAHDDAGIKHKGFHVHPATHHVVKDGKHYQTAHHSEESAERHAAHLRKANPKHTYTVHPTHEMVKEAAEPATRRATLRRPDGRAITVTVPAVEAAEPSFAERVLAAARGEQPVAEAQPEVPAELVASFDAVEAAGLDLAALAAFALVESMTVEELAGGEHHVDVHYRLHGTAAAKETVHHLISHAKKHGAHGYDADGYEGHIRFKFKTKAHAHAFHQTASDARDVHKATIAHHEESVTIEAPEPALDEAEVVELDVVESIHKAYGSETDPAKLLRMHAHARKMTTSDNATVKGRMAYHKLADKIAARMASLDHKDESVEALTADELIDDVVLEADKPLGIARGAKLKAMIHKDGENMARYAYRNHDSGRRDTIHNWGVPGHFARAMHKAGREHAGDASPDHAVRHIHAKLMRYAKDIKEDAAEVYESDDHTQSVGREALARIAAHHAKHGGITALALHDGLSSAVHHHRELVAAKAKGLAHDHEVHHAAAMVHKRVAGINQHLASPSEESAESAAADVNEAEFSRHAIKAGFDKTTRAGASVVHSAHREIKGTKAHIGVMHHNLGKGHEHPDGDYVSFAHHTAPDGKVTRHDKRFKKPADAVSHAKSHTLMRESVEEAKAAEATPAPVEPMPVVLPSDGNAPAPTPGTVEVVSVHLTTPMGEAHEDLSTLLHVFGGKPSPGGGYAFPKRTAQAFVNKYMANGGKAYILVNGEKHGPNEDADDLPGFDPLGIEQVDEAEAPAGEALRHEVNTKAEAHGLRKVYHGTASVMRHDTGLRRGVMTVVNVEAHKGKHVAAVRRHHLNHNGDAVGRPTTKRFDSVDAALAHAKKVHHEESVDMIAPGDEVVEAESRKDAQKAIEPGAHAVAQRIANAHGEFHAALAKAGEITHDDARDVGHAYIKHKLAKLDPVAGKVDVKHGSLMSKDTIRTALGNLRKGKKG